MPRYRIIIEYDGTPFSGWQSQTNAPAVQDALQRALFAFTKEAVTLRGAGRTDSGVHALAQVAHFDLDREWEAFRLREALNHHLRPDPISIVGCDHVSEKFDARFSALARHYRYVILNRRGPPALLKNRAWWVPVPLDAERMHEAAQTLVGHHDFTTFRASLCQAASPLKTLDHLDVARAGDEIVVTASARSFLHNQVRSMVGSLRMVGEGKWTVADCRSALKAADRRACGPVAPPDGLYLTKVDYPDDAEFAVGSSEE